MRTIGVTLGLLLVAAPLAAMAEPAPADAPAEDGDAPSDAPPVETRMYPIRRIDLRVATDGLATLPLDRITLTLAYTGESFAAAGDEMAKANREVTLSTLDALPNAPMRASAVRAISQAIVRAYNDAGHGGVLVELGSDQVDAQGNDIRDADDQTMVMIVRALPITTVGTRAAGDRFEGDAPDHPAHRAMAARSPVQPGGLLATSAVEEYARFLSRHPGRQVDAAVAAADTPDALALNYLVQENKPWTIYATISNTGTDQTAQWRQQFGFTHYQLTGRDDIFNLTYSTAGFEDTHAVSGSYEFVLFDPRLRAKVFASYSEFVASDVGFAGANFSGESWSAGGELAYNIFQRGQWFIDLVAGAQYQDIEVSNELFMPTLEGQEQFIRPRVGARSQRVTETSALFGSMMFDWNLDDLAGTDAADASRLGRAAVDAAWLILSFNASASVYLEPLLNRSAWEDLTTPGSSTLAHEIVASVRGQHVFNDRRAIPQAQITAGGFYTVRGYDESTTVGDNAVIVSGEYRFHLPRVLSPRPEPTQLFGHDFRARPPAPRGRPDWDLILKAFVDYAHVSTNRDTPGEMTNDLVGTGAGVELWFKRNFNVRVEWGIALSAADEVDAGDNRFHIAATFAY